MQRVAAIAARGLTFPNMEQKYADLFSLILYTNHFTAPGSSGKDTYFNFFMLVSFKGKAKCGSQLGAAKEN